MVSVTIVVISTDTVALLVSVVVIIITGTLIILNVVSLSLMSMLFFVIATQADPWHYRHHCQCHVIDTLFTVIIANSTLSAVQIISATVHNTDNTGTAVLSTVLCLCRYR